jgi:hypothetical protein
LLVLDGDLLVDIKNARKILLCFTMGGLLRNFRRRRLEALTA